MSSSYPVAFGTFSLRMAQDCAHKTFEILFQEVSRDNASRMLWYISFDYYSKMGNMLPFILRNTRTATLVRLKGKAFS